MWCWGVVDAGDVSLLPTHTQGLVLANDCDTKFIPVVRTRKLASPTTVVAVGNAAKFPPLFHPAGTHCVRPRLPNTHAHRHTDTDTALSPLERRLLVVAASIVYEDQCIMGPNMGQYA